ncbi:MAG TPA: hypothetical protein VM118_11075 [Acidobacteriota bacterium]|nr:hypothetical protein [Acidobacteriota bacterium]
MLQLFDSASWIDRLFSLYDATVDLMHPPSRYPPNHPRVRKQNRTNITIAGTSINTPTTVANAAPEERAWSVG